MDFTLSQEQYINVTGQNYIQVNSQFPLSPIPDYS